jgi:hypothetical protein
LHTSKSTQAMLAYNYIAQAGILHQSALITQPT